MLRFFLNNKSVFSPPNVNNFKILIKWQKQDEVGTASGIANTNLLSYTEINRLASAIMHF